MFSVPDNLTDKLIVN